MLRQFSLSLPLCFFILTLRLLGEPLADLQTNFQTRCDFPAADRDSLNTKLDASYLSALQTHLEKAKTTGKLDTVLPLHDEVLAMKAAKFPLPELTKGASIELVQMRTKHTEARTKILKSHAETLTTLADQMDGALKNLESELTKTGKIDDALAVKQVRTSLATDQTILAAKSRLNSGIVTTNGEGWKSLLLEKAQVENKQQTYVGPLTLAKENLQKTYLKGLQDPNVKPESIYITHAPSKVQFKLDQKATQMRGKIFLANPSGSVRFKIFAGEKLVFDYLMKQKPSIHSFEIKFEPTDQIRFEADPHGNSEFDWSAWASPEIR